MGAYNVPSYSSKRFSFGPGIMYLGVAGTTPTMDIGAVTGDFALEVDRTVLAIEQGSPQTVVQQYCVKEDVKFSVTGIEWNMTNMSYLLGAGVTTQSGANEQLDFGGDFNLSNRAVRFVHIQPDGSTIDIQIFNAQGGGKIKIGGKSKAPHEFPYDFVALLGTVDFQNAAVPNLKNKFRIIRTQA